MRYRPGEVRSVAMMRLKNAPVAKRYITSTPLLKQQLGKIEPVAEAAPALEDTTVLIKEKKRSGITTFLLLVAGTAGFTIGTYHLLQQPQIRKEAKKYGLLETIEKLETRMDCMHSLTIQHGIRLLSKIEYSHHGRNQENNAAIMDSGTEAPPTGGECEREA